MNLKYRANSCNYLKKVRHTKVLYKYLIEREPEAIGCGWISA